MGKKRRRPVAYDPNALINLAHELKRVRKELQKDALVKLDINMTKLEEAIHSLPKKQREVLEKYWGLVPGTVAIGRSEAFKKALKKDIAKWNMKNEAWEAMETLRGLDYVCMYDQRAKDLVNKIANKCDTTDLQLTDLETVKYLIVFLVFFIGGQKMIYEEELETLSDEKEAISGFDLYTLLEVSWNISIQVIPDGGINLGLLLQAIEMFDCEQIAYMKRYVGLPLGKEFERARFEPLESFQEIRKFKEQLFPNGEWTLLCILVYSQRIEKVKLDDFWEEVWKLKSNNWKKINNYRVSQKKVKTTRGTKTIPVYQIGDIQITDLYEIQFLSLMSAQRAIVA